MRKYGIIALITAALVGASWYGFAKGIFKGEAATTVSLDEAGLQLATTEATSDVTPAEKKILEEVQGLFTAFTGNTPLYMTGTMKAVDPADTTAFTDFVFYRQGATLYYATNVQTLRNDSLAYTVADHSTRQLLVMPPRSVEAAQSLPLPELTKLLAEDNYKITREEEDGMITFRLLNEKHITCKEMRIKVKAGTKEIVALYYRFTDMDHLEEKEADKELTVTIHNWQTGASALAAFAVPALMQVAPAGRVPAKAYEDYTITDLTTH